MAGAGSVIETAKLIKTEMLERGKVPPDLRAEVYHVQDGVGVALFVFERYYMRTSGFTSLTVAVTGDNEAVYVDGIGAGGGVDGQVLVIHDMLGINQEFSPRFLRRYHNLYAEISGAVGNYIADVKSGDFPNEREQY